MTRKATKIIICVITVCYIIKALDLVRKRRIRRSNDLLPFAGKNDDSLTKYSKDLREIADDYELQRRMRKVLEKKKNETMKKSRKKVQKKTQIKEDRSRMGKSEEWWNKGVPNNFLKTLEGILKRDYDDGSRCAVGYYRLRGMKECKPWLTCNEINNQTVLTKAKYIAGGIGKVVSIVF